MKTAFVTAESSRAYIKTLRAQELCESRGGRPGLPVLISLIISLINHPNSPYGLCGHKATMKHAHTLVTVCP